MAQRKESAGTILQPKVIPALAPVNERTHLVVRGGVLSCGVARLAGALEPERNGFVRVDACPLLPVVAFWTRNHHDRDDQKRGGEGVEKQPQPVVADDHLGRVHELTDEAALQLPPEIEPPSGDGLLHTRHGQGRK